MSKFMNGVVIFVVGAVVGAGLTYHAITKDKDESQASLMSNDMTSTQKPAMPTAAPEAAAPAAPAPEAAAAPAPAAPAVVPAAPATPAQS